MAVLGKIGHMIVTGARLVALFCVAVLATVYVTTLIVRLNEAAPRHA